MHKLRHNNNYAFFFFFFYEYYDNDTHNLNEIFILSL